MEKVFKPITEIIESRGYLLDNQKERLLEDLEFVESDIHEMEEIIDRIFYRLFGKGWHGLSTEEQMQIKDAWEER